MPASEDIWRETSWDPASSANKCVSPSCFRRVGRTSHCLAAKLCWSAARLGAVSLKALHSAEHLQRTLDTRDPAPRGELYTLCDGLCKRDFVCTRCSIFNLCFCHGGTIGACHGFAIVVVAESCSTVLEQRRPVPIHATSNISSVNAAQHACLARTRLYVKLYFPVHPEPCAFTVHTLGTPHLQWLPLSRSQVAFSCTRSLEYLRWVDASDGCVPRTPTRHVLMASSTQSLESVVSIQSQNRQ